MYLWNLHPIKAVVFDAFGTVIDYPVKLSPYALLRRHWRSEQGFKQACLTQNIALPDLLQQLELDTLWPEMQSLLAQERMHLALYPEVPEVMKKLQQLQVKTAICSNLAHAYGTDVRRLLPDVDATILSYEAGHAKPEMAIYALVEQQLHVPKEQILFVGDTQRCDYDGPKAYGFHAAHLQRHLGQDLHSIVFPPNARQPSR
ncbi:MAG: HAD family hydrolase [Vitreoscilla sp.]|nr:HAD family hydrolase [Vitreoscilla sp.]